MASVRPPSPASLVKSLSNLQVRVNGGLSGPAGQVPVNAVLDDNDRPPIFSVPEDPFSRLGVPMFSAPDQRLPNVVEHNNENSLSYVNEMTYGSTNSVSFLEKQVGLPPKRKQPTASLRRINPAKKTNRFTLIEKRFGTSKHQLRPTRSQKQLLYDLTPKWQRPSPPKGASAKKSNTYSVIHQLTKLGAKVSTAGESKDKWVVEASKKKKKKNRKDPSLSTRSVAQSKSRAKERSILRKNRGILGHSKSTGTLKRSQENRTRVRRSRGSKSTTFLTACDGLDETSQENGNRRRERVRSRRTSCASTSMSSVHRVEKSRSGPVPVRFNRGYKSETERYLARLNKSYRKKQEGVNSSLKNPPPRRKRRSDVSNRTSGRSSTKVPLGKTRMKSHGETQSDRLQSSTFLTSLLDGVDTEEMEEEIEEELQCRTTVDISNLGAFSNTFLTSAGSPQNVVPLPQRKSKTDLNIRRGGCRHQERRNVDDDEVVDESGGLTTSLFTSKKRHNVQRVSKTVGRGGRRGRSTLPKLPKRQAWMSSSVLKQQHSPYREGGISILGASRSSRQLSAGARFGKIDRSGRNLSFARSR